MPSSCESCATTLILQLEDAGERPVDLRVGHAPRRSATLTMRAVMRMRSPLR